MIFSKSFGYAVRGILYIASVQEKKHFVHVEEISARIEAPRHFVGKIMKKLAKEGVLHSVKGPSGGFAINDKTLAFSLVQLFDITNDVSALNNCVLRMKECSSEHPCAMHFKVEEVKKQLKEILSGTTLNDLFPAKQSPEQDNIQNKEATKLKSLLRSI